MKYYLCKQNNRRSLLGRKQQKKVVRSFPKRYLFSPIRKVTSLFSNRYVFMIILHSNLPRFTKQKAMYCIRQENVLLRILFLFSLLSFLTIRISSYQTRPYHRKSNNGMTATSKKFHATLL